MQKSQENKIKECQAELAFVEDERKNLSRITSIQNDLLHHLQDNSEFTIEQAKDLMATIEELNWHNMETFLSVVVHAANALFPVGAVKFSSDYVANHWKISHDIHESYSRDNIYTNINNSNMENSQIKPKEEDETSIDNPPYHTRPIAERLKDYQYDSRFNVLSMPEYFKRDEIDRVEKYLQLNEAICNLKKVTEAGYDVPEVDKCITKLDHERYFVFKSLAGQN